MITTGSADAIGDAVKYPYLLRTSPRSAFQAQTFVDFMRKRGSKKVAMLAVNNALGTSVTDAVKTAIQGTDITITGTEFFETNAVDLTAQATKLKDSGADILIAVSTATPDQIATIKARNQLNWKVPVIGFSTMAVPQVTDGVGGASAMADVFAGQNYHTLTNPTPEMTDWLKKIRIRLNTTPLTRDIQQVVTGYDQVFMAADSADKTGGFDGDKIIAYREANVFQGIKASYEYSKQRHDGEGLDDLVFVVASSLKDGTYTEAPTK
jgi:ABC-type branched-subunit amino acid transport system substrate-binding protein